MVETHDALFRIPNPRNRRQQNRPYSVANIVDALQKAGVKKTAIERALAALVAQGTVSKKEYGKSSVFMLAQDKLELPNPEEMKQVDEDIKNRASKLQELDSQLEELRTEEKSLRNVRTLEETKQELSRLQTDIEQKETKLSKLGDGSQLMTKEEKMQVETKYFALHSAWKKRKRMVKSIADIIGESSGMKPKDFYVEVGIETDEEVSADFSTYLELRNPAKQSRLGAPRPPKRARAQ